MCPALPARVVERRGPDDAVVDLDGVRKTVPLSLVEDVQVGDDLIVHVGFALQKLDVEEAEATLALFRELKQAQPGRPTPVRCGAAQTGAIGYTARLDAPFAGRRCFVHPL